IQSLGEIFRCRAGVGTERESPHLVRFQKKDRRGTGQFHYFKTAPRLRGRSGSFISSSLSRVKNMPSPPVRFALVGYGAWGQVHARSIAGHPEAVLTAIVAPSDAS